MNLKKQALILLTLIPLVTFSQSLKNYDFIGTLVLENNALITYRIQFDINNSNISGFSYTDLNGNDETKSKLIGTYNEKENKIFIEETDIIYTKSKELKDIFCFLKIDANIKLSENKNEIKGNFIGVYNSEQKDTCATGKILLVSLKDAFRKIDKVAKKISKIKKIDSITKNKFTKQNLINQIGTNTLKSEEILNVFWKSNKLIIEIWDNGKEDGDLISLTFNKKTIFRKHEVKKDKIIIELDLVEGINLIEILANNNGTIFPNTAKVILIDGDVQHTISSSLEAGKSSTIKIIYKQD